MITTTSSAMMDVFNSAYTDYAYTMPTVSLTAGESEDYATIYSDINAYISATFPLFIIGDMPMSALDTFVDTINELGIVDCVAYQQASYDRYLTR